MDAAKVRRAIRMMLVTSWLTLVVGGLLTVGVRETAGCNDRAGPRKMAYSHQFVRSALGSSDEGRIDSSVYSLLKRFPFAGSVCPPATRNKNRHAFGGMHEAQRRGIPHLIERL